MIKNMDLAFSIGEIIKDMKGSGIMENKMAEVTFFLSNVYTRKITTKIGFIILPNSEKKEGIWEDGKRIKWILDV